MTDPIRTAESADIERLSADVVEQEAVVLPLGETPKYRKSDVAPETAAEAPRTEPIVTLDVVRADPEVQAFIRQANKNLGVLGFTEHGFRHVGLVSNIARNVLRLLEYDARQQELAAIAGYLHDIGNVVSRHGHPVSAALILADKSDVHRSRVRNTYPTSFDQHDRVNYAATSSFLRVDAAAKTITLELTIDTTMAPVIEYFEIFLPRMLMSRHAAELLDCVFHITINEVVVL
jgi:metal-dependent HD superfamily phosphatase/phosphodiesterase